MTSRNAIPGGAESHGNDETAGSDPTGVDPATMEVAELDPWSTVGPGKAVGSSDDAGPDAITIPDNKAVDTPSSDSREELPGGAFITHRDEYYRNLRKHHIKYLKRRTKQRQTMMKWSLSIATGIVAISALAMALYMWSQWGDIRAEVMLGWFTSIAVQIIGIVYIVASYLFPKNDHAVENLIGNLDGTGGQRPDPASDDAASGTV